MVIYMVKNKTGEKEQSKFMLRMSAAMYIFAAVLIVLACFFLVSLMSDNPKTQVMIRDDANVFSENEIILIENAAQHLCDHLKMNVVVITTRDKNATISLPNEYYDLDWSRKEFAADFYHLKVAKEFKDNRGIVILVDLTEGANNMECFNIYSMGTIKFVLSSGDITRIISPNKEAILNRNYSKAVLYSINGILMDLNSAIEVGRLVYNALPFVLAVLLAIPITKRILSASRKLGRRPSSTEYRAKETVIKSINSHKYTKTETVPTNMHIFGVFMNFVISVFKKVFVGEEK